MRRALCAIGAAALAAVAGPSAAAVFTSTYHLDAGFNRSRVTADVYISSAVEIDLSESELFQYGSVWGGEFYHDGPEIFELANSISKTDFGYRLEFYTLQTQFIFDQPAEEWAGEVWWHQGTITIRGKTEGEIGDYSVVFTERDRRPIPRFIPAGQPGSLVPEPATWAMLLCGFGLAGAALRRRILTPRFGPL